MKGSFSFWAAMATVAPVSSAISGFAPALRSSSANMSLPVDTATSSGVFPERHLTSEATQQHQQHRIHLLHGSGITQISAARLGHVACTNLFQPRRAFQAES